MNLTLVAFYGRKTRQFRDFIRWCQNLVAKQIPNGFRPYDIAQVHATIVGLEGICKDNQILNTNYNNLGSTRFINFNGLLNFLNSDQLPEFRVKIGGYLRNAKYPFTSNKQHPFLRSFTVQSSNNIIVIGWPENEGEFPDTLNDLRRKFNKFNILHKYHEVDGGFDNDLFFVLGRVEPDALDANDRKAISEAVRVQLAEIEPIYLNLTKDDLSIVAYNDNELPLSSSVRIPINHMVLGEDKLISYYGDAT